MDESEDPLSNSQLNKPNDLFDEERPLGSDPISIKKYTDPSDREGWKIRTSTEEIIIKATSLSNKEINFLNTLEGMQFLLKIYKDGGRKIKDFQKLWKQKIK